MPLSIVRRKLAIKVRVNAKKITENKLNQKITNCSKIFLERKV
jgi:hypothetical protein